MAERARAASYEPYKPYTGQRFADTPNQINRARDLTNEYTRVYVPYLNSATNLATEAARDFPSQAGFYMNPYNTHVVDNIAHYGNRNFNENVLPKINDTFTRVGAFGGGRHRDMMARMTRRKRKMKMRKSNSNQFNRILLLKKKLLQSLRMLLFAWGNSNVPIPNWVVSFRNSSSMFSYRATWSTATLPSMV